MSQVISPAATRTGPFLAARTLDLSKPKPMDPGTIAVIVVSCVLVTAFIAAGIWRVVVDKRAKKAKARTAVPGDDPESGLAMSETAANATPGENGEAAAAVDRHTSVRSIMTLPPYRPKPLDNEAVLGREGERDGIDVVVEMPTAEEDEALREQEMDSLFQIRVARQRQAEEREARREARRIARERNDEAALQAIRQQAATASTSNAEAIALLREEHSRVRETRARAGSSVNYADVGVARNDGTRLRANSAESERVGLLSDAASMSAPGHHRGRSGSSVLTAGSSRSNSPTEPLRQVPSAYSQASTNMVGPADGDALGDVHLPPHNPPGYDEVSLSDLTPAVSHTVPPPLYESTEPAADEAGPTAARNRRVSARISDVAAEALRADTDAAGVPRIVIDPTSATAANGERL